MKKQKDLPVNQGSGNVFADLGLRGAADLQIKAELTRQLYHRIKSIGLTQTDAADRLGLKQPDVSRLMAGRFTGFSIDRLLSLFGRLDIDVEIVLHPRKPSSARKGKVKVRAAAA